MVCCKKLQEHMLNVGKIYINKVASGLRAPWNLSSESAASFFSVSKHFVHVGPQVLARILSPLPTVQILPDLIIDQSGCFGLIMDGLGQEIIKMAPHFVDHLRSSSDFAAVLCKSSCKLKQTVLDLWPFNASLLINLVALYITCHILTGLLIPYFLTALLGV